MEACRTAGTGSESDEHPTVETNGSGKLNDSVNHRKPDSASSGGCNGQEMPADAQLDSASGETADGDNHRKQDSDSPEGPCDSNGQKMQADAQLDSASGETADGNSVCSTTLPPSPPKLDSENVSNPKKAANDVPSAQGKDVESKSKGLDLSIEEFVEFCKKEGIEKESDLQKLRDEGITLKALITFEPEDINLSSGGRKILQKILKDLKQEKDADHQGAPEMQNLPWCMDAFMVKPGEQGAKCNNETKSGAAQRRYLWSSDGTTNGIVLRVKFLNDVPSQWRYSGGGLNHESVLNLAKEWEKCGTVRFTEVKGDATADIRVKFIDLSVTHEKLLDLFKEATVQVLKKHLLIEGNTTQLSDKAIYLSAYADQNPTWEHIENSLRKCGLKSEADDVKATYIDGRGSSRSYVGSKAQNESPKPSMWLNLSSGDDNYKRHLVVHEFGHALGLEHEHQRPDLWDAIGKYINIDAMLKDKDLQGNLQWLEDMKLKLTDDLTLSNYDPQSIMHYWFKSNWLKAEYASEEKVKQNRDLKEKEKAALLGIHMCSRGILPTVPSEGDLDHLKMLYGVNHGKPDSDSLEGPCDSNVQEMQADAQLDSVSGETADGDNYRKQDSDSPEGPCDSNGQKMQADAQLDSASGETADGNGVCSTTLPPSPPKLDSENVSNPKKAANDAPSAQGNDVQSKGPKMFKRLILGKNLPSSIPLLYRSNYEYDPEANQLTLKQDCRVSEVKMQLYPKAARLLSAIKKPVAVVSICGRYRSGKSYFLSRMLGSSNAFSLGHTMHACTFGIWIGTTALECDDYVLLLLDTEGIDALGTSGALDASILVMTILLSSYMIYNSLQVPTRGDLEKMSCFTELSQSISIRSGEENEDMTDFRAHFPDFLWLLRDVILETTDKETGKIITATEFLKTQVLYRSRKMIPDIADNVVMCIRNYFPTFECIKLPPPSVKKEVMNNIAEKEDELSPEFLSSMASAIEYVLQVARVKKGFNGNTVVNGSTLMDLTRHYLEAVNKPNAVPSLDLSWQSVVDAQLIKLRKTLLVEYSNEMQAALRYKLPLEVGRKDDGHLQKPTLIGIHERVLAVKRARLEREMSYLLPVNMHEKLHVRTFDSRKANFLASFELQVVAYVEVVEDGDVVEQVADGLLFKFVQQNYNESVTFCTTLFQNLLKPIEVSIKESIKTGGRNGYTFENLQDDAERMHDKYYQEARGPAKDFVFKEKKESILDHHMQMYETMIGFSKDLFEARQKAFEANQQALEARQRVDKLEKDIKELEKMLRLKQKELDEVRIEQDRIIKDLEMDLNKQIEEERRKYEELSKATELQDGVSAEASKLKVQEMEEVSRQIMEEMKAEQQKRVGELAQEISETREKLDLLAAKQSKSSTEKESGGKDSTKSVQDQLSEDKKKKKGKKMKTKMTDDRLYEKERSCMIL